MLPTLEYLPTASQLITMLGRITRTLGCPCNPNTTTSLLTHTTRESRRLLVLFGIVGSPFRPIFLSCFFDRANLEEDGGGAKRPWRCLFEIGPRFEKLIDCRRQDDVVNHMILKLAETWKQDGCLFVYYQSSELRHLRSCPAN